MRKYWVMDIKALRKNLGLTLKSVAKSIGTDPGNLSRIERNVQLPGISLAKKISEFYGISLDQIFSSKRVSDDSLPKSQRQRAA